MIHLAGVVFTALIKLIMSRGTNCLMDIGHPVTSTCRVLTCVDV